MSADMMLNESVSICVGFGNFLYYNKVQIQAM